MGETPIIFENRHQGHSKISQTEIYKAMYTVLRLTIDRFVFRQSSAFWLKVNHVRGKTNF